MTRWIILSVETVVMCALFFLICYLSTGSDKKNIKQTCYPDEALNAIKNTELGTQIKKQNVLISFLSNVGLFTVLLFVLCMFIRQKDFLGNFVNVTIIGQVLNAFDFFIIDLLWWRHTKRIRFSGTENNAELYRNPKKHFMSFLKGIAAFLVVAALDGLLGWGLSMIW